MVRSRSVFDRLVRAALSRVSERPTTVTSALSASNEAASANPIPELPPTIRTRSDRVSISEFIQPPKRAQGFENTEAPGCGFPPSQRRSETGMHECLHPNFQSKSQTSSLPPPPATHLIPQLFN